MKPGDTLEVAIIKTDKGYILVHLGSKEYLMPLSRRQLIRKLGELIGA